jgi:rubrerythrin
MKHFYLKFNHGVEIGARLAYLGHYKRTKDRNVLNIANEELVHQQTLKKILRFHGELPSKPIDVAFSLIGNTVSLLCRISPRFMLNFVASTLETFAIFSYGYLAVVYPIFRENFLLMAKAERQHERYFKALK